MNIRPLKFVGILVLSGFVCLSAFMLGTPPWKGRTAFLVQSRIADWTGLWLHQFPEDYTGPFRIWNEAGGLTGEWNYRGGLRHGTWTQYDGSGNVLNRCEYRDGAPWDGLCKLHEMKAWSGEYRQGRPWNGYLAGWNEALKKTEMKFFLAGEEIPEADYKQRRGIPADAICYGLQWWQP